MAPPADVRRSFDEAVDAYDHIRPTYPEALFDDLFASLAPRPEVLEVGPGTGQATRALLARGAAVQAVELGPRMAERLRANLPTERLRVTVGDVETVPLRPASVDAVVAASAFHWLSPEGQTDLPAAVLRPGGVVAVVDLVQVDAPEDAGFFATAQPVYDRHGQGHTGPPAPTPDAVDPPARAVLAADERFGEVAVRCYRHDQTYTAAGYRQLMLSYSGTQMMEADRRAALLDAIEALVRREFGGRVTRPLVAALTTAVRTKGV